MIMDPASGLMLDEAAQQIVAENPPPPIFKVPPRSPTPTGEEFMGLPTLPQDGYEQKDIQNFLKTLKDNPVSTLTKPQKDTAANVLKQYTLTTAQLNAAQGETLPENFNLPAYGEIYAPIFEQQFPAIKNTDDLLANGLIDDNGATDKGLLVLDLKKVGALNDDYTLNLTGKALLSSPEEAEKPENLAIFMERQRLELDEPEDKSWGATWNEFKKILGSTRDTLTALIPEGTAPTAPTAFMPPGAYYMPTGKEAEVGYTAKQKAILEGAVSGIIQQESGLALGAKKIASDILVKIVSDGEKEKVALAAIDQKYQRDKRQIEAYKASESFHEITGLTNWVDQMEKVKTELGDEGFKAARKTGMEGGPMLYSAINPLAAENLAFRTAMSASMVPMKLMSSQVLRARQTAEAFVEQTQSLNAANAAISKAQASIKFGEKIPELEKAQLAFQQAGDMASARSVGKNIEKVRTASQKAVFEVEQWGKAAQSITENLTRLSADAAAANRIIKVADTFAQWPKVITTPVGYSLQKLGQGMTAIDSNLAAASEKIGAGKFYRGMNKLSSLAGVGTVAQTAGLPGELAWFPAAFKAAWSTAPAIEATGDFIRLVGREASAARGAIPMWRKIYRMQDAGIAHRLVAGSMDLATLGGLPAVQNAVKGAVAGTAAGVPLDMAYNYVSSGGEMNANAFKESVVSNAFFAGGGAAIGAIRMGSQKRLKQFQQGDVLNFRRSITDPDQKMAFDALPRGVRDSLGSYSGANPNLIIKFVKEGGGNFVASTNTVSINPAAKNPLKPLLAHELLESIVARTSMSSSIASILVGDGVQTGGLLRDKNGNLDPDFIAFRDRYNQLRQAETNRMNQMVEPDKRKKFTPLTDREMAKEYFIEMNADDMAAMAESGKLGQLAARSTAVRKMVDLGNTILNKSSIIRNMHFNLGGMMDSSGRMVAGNGLLADGIKQLPEAKALFERMINETAGRPGAAKQTAEKSQGTVIPTSGMDDPIWSEMTSYWKTDKAGNPIRDSSGNWVPLEKYIEDAREQAGLIIQADQKQRIANGEVIPKHEIQYSPETGWRGKYFSAAQIEMVKNTGYFNDSQIKLFDHINEAAKRGQGERFLMIYNPATSSRLRGRGRKSYETLGPTMKEGGILGFSMGEKGQILIDIIDTQQLHQNIMEQAGKKIGQKLYKGNVDKIMSDINAVIELHAEGKPADSHFIENYGTDWKDHKNFINATFGDISGGAKARPADYMMINPVLVTDRPSKAVFKTYRLDRLNKATRMEGTTGIPMDYNKVKANYMPEGVPLFTEDGDPVDMRYTPVEDENGNLRAVPSNDYGKQNGVAPEEVITQNQRTNESGQRIAGTGTGDRTLEGDASTTGEILGRGGMVGSSVRVRPPDSSPYWNTPLSGLPTKVTIESRGKTVDFGPNDTARKAAWDYAESSGIKYNPPETYSIVSKEQGKRLADGYEAMVHSPNDPKVKASYDAMIKETLDQYQFIKKTGLKIEPIPLGMVDPYLETPRLANLDVLENNHLWFFPTDSGFGTKGVTAKKVLNLLESPTDEYIGNHRLLANDVFRIVHDYFGHIKEGVGFRGDGEENAWRSHSAMYSDLARPAMTSETRGQNMWVNHGPYAEHNRKANGTDTIYAEQKNALPPEWMVNEGAGDTPPASSDIRYMPEVSSGKNNNLDVIDFGDKDTLDVIQQRDDKGQLKSQKGKPVPVTVDYQISSAPHIEKFAGVAEDPSTSYLDSLPYDLTKPQREKINELIKTGVVDNLANKMVIDTQEMMKNPSISAGKGWYSRMRTKLLDTFGADGRELLSQLLGATSAQTPVDENFLQALDAYEGVISGRYDRHRKGYLEMVKAESEGSLNDLIDSSNSISELKRIKNSVNRALKKKMPTADRNALESERNRLAKLIKKPAEKRTSAERFDIYIIGNDLLPLRSNGKKFNANSDSVLKVIAGTWLNNRKSPKTPNFAGNLSGRTVQATIDLWAARYLRRLVYSGEGAPYRIQPKAEVGVNNQDFAFSQVVMERAAKKLGMNPDDLQAILWFAEKDVWDKNGWTKNEGAKKSSFDDIFDMFFPKGKKALSFKEGSEIIRKARDAEALVKKEEAAAQLKADAEAEGISVTALKKKRAEAKKNKPE